jgi:hypothetical protein
VEDSAAVGIISRRDVDRARFHGFGHAPVRAYMNRSVVTITPQTPLPEIERIMIERDIGRLPVMEGKELVGIVTRSDVLRALHGITMPGVTVSDPGQDLGYLLRSISMYGLQPIVRIGIAAPAPGRHNRYAPLRDHRRIASAIVAFAGECDRRDVSIMFDCGFRLCSFTERQLGRLQYCNSPVKTVCAPVFDVAPDLTVTRCFATAGMHAANLKEFKDFAALTEHFERRFGMLSAMSVGKECAACRHFKRGQCHGGCLGYRLASFQNSRT